MQDCRGGGASVRTLGRVKVLVKVKLMQIRYQVGAEQEGGMRAWTIASSNNSRCPRQPYAVRVFNDSSPCPRSGRWSQF
jgi:hypothetical protein